MKVRGAWQSARDCCSVSRAGPLDERSETPARATTECTSSRSLTTAETGCASGNTRSSCRRLLSIQLSIETDIIRNPQDAITADRAVRQRFADFLADFLLPLA
jgi:hypothetical protein